MERDDIFQEDPSNRSPLALEQDTLLNDQFRIGRVLGVGGFGVTYLAFDEVLEMVVAVKEYLPNDIAVRKSDGDTIQPLTSSGEQKGFEYGLERFLQEARTLAKFERHPNIVRVRTFFQENGTAYLVMNFYEGRTLAEYLTARNGFIPEDEALLIMEQVLDGLSAVHEEDVLHRDIDPNNVYLADDGTVVLLDFGAARTAVGERTQSMSVVLKRGYAPHEQYHSHGDQGPWTDVYATSATLYRSLTGYKPPEAAARILKDELAPPNELVPSLSDATNDAVLEGLAIRPENRPQSVEKLAELLPAPSDDAEPGWVGEPTSLDAPGGDTQSAAELQVTATHACRLYVDGSLTTELPAEEAYTVAVEPGNHRVRAVRTDQAGSGNATVTASGTDDGPEQGGHMSLDTLMWQEIVAASEDEPTAVAIDFEDPGAAEMSSASDEDGETVAAGSAPVPGETAQPEEDAASDAASADEDPTRRSETIGTVNTDEASGEAGPEDAEPQEPAEAAVSGDDDAPPEDASSDQTEASPPGRVSIQTARAVHLYIDGEKKARVDPDDEQEVALPAGERHIRAEAVDGSATWEDTVAVEPGGARSVEIVFDRPVGAEEEPIVSTATLRYGGGGVGVLMLLLAVWWWAFSNEAPRPTADRALTTTDPVVVDVVANDRDPDGRQEALRIHSVPALADSIGRVEAVDSTHLRIEPAADFAGIARVGYVVADAHDDTAHAHVTLRVPFDGRQQVVTRQTQQPQNVHAARIDGDGLDLAIAALDDRAVGWVRNVSSGAGRFDSLSVLKTSEDGAVDVHAADLTSNGRLDLLSASLRADALTWYENRGKDAFGAPQSISTSIDGPVAVETADVDGDGDSDVITGALLGERLLWYENRGDGSFGDAREIAGGIGGLETLHVTDLDNDDAPDLLAVSYRDSTIHRYEPKRSASGSVQFETGPPISTELSGPIEVHTADVTGDGWKDVLVGLGGAESVVVVENRTDTTGTLAFGEGRALASDVETVEGLDTGDVNGDGTLDVVAGSFDSDAVVWFKNEGNGRFTPAQTIARGVPNVLSLEAADVNGDGSPDVIAAAQAGNMVVWYENYLQ